MVHVTLKHAQERVTVTGSVCDTRTPVVEVTLKHKDALSIDKFQSGSEVAEREVKETGLVPVHMTHSVLSRIIQSGINGAVSQAYGYPLVFDLPYLMKGQHRVYSVRETLSGITGFGAHLADHITVLAFFPTGQCQFPAS
jgi:hypothetical protein